MKQTVVTTYTAKELQAQFPEGFKRAFEDYKNDNVSYTPWADEIIESMKAAIKAAGLRLNDYEIGPYSRSSVEIACFDAQDLTGPRAIAWLENNLYSPLRIKKNTKNNLKYNRSYTDKSLRPYSIGKIPPCPFTGYCADEDMIESLNKSIASGRTLGEAFCDLAYIASHLLELEIEYQNSEECFLDTSECNEWQFTEDGALFTA